MALKTIAQLEQERQALARYVLGKEVQLDRTRILYIYCRQSTDKQYFKSDKNNTQQRSELEETAYDALNWPRELVIVMVENDTKHKQGDTSGTRHLEDRPLLRKIHEDVKAGKVGAVLVVDVSRLSRDEDLIDPTVFAKACREADTAIITAADGYIYDFNHPSRDDLGKFMDEAKLAANFIKYHVKRKMLKARTGKANAGKSANGIAPVGLLVVDDTLIASPHAENVDRLYAMFREHEANLNATLNELTAMARRGEPIFPVCDGIDEKSMFLSRVERGGVLLGWTVASRFGLKHILTNAAYAGHLVFNGRVVKRNAFPAIVDAANWQYAFDHLADVGLDGETIVHEQKTVRYTQKTSEDKGALLAGTRHNGTPVIDGLDGSHVYYKSNTERYILRKVEGIGGYEAAIGAHELDRIFEEHLLKHLARSEFLATTTLKSIVHFTGRGRIETPLPEIHETAYAVNGTERTATTPDDTLETLTETIADQERHIRVGGKHMTDSELEKAYERLARLRKRRGVLEERQANEERIQAELQRAMGDVCLACDQWAKWDVERRRRLVRLATESIILETLADGWLRLTVKWTAVLGGLVEECYIWQTSGSTWQESELAILHESYATATRKELMQLLPARTWHAINNRANELGLRRTVLDPGTSKAIDISVSDREVIERFGLAVRRVQWAYSQVSSDDSLS